MSLVTTYLYVSYSLCEKNVPYRTFLVSQEVKENLKSVSTFETVNNCFLEPQKISIAEAHRMLRRAVHE